VDRASTLGFRLGGSLQVGMGLRSGGFAGGLGAKGCAEAKKCSRLRDDQLNGMVESRACRLERLNVRAWRQ
jgi:hypothetical protein